MKENLLILFTSLLLLSSCGGSAPLTENREISEKEASMLSAFAKQEHRFELSGCENFYNDQQFLFGMPIEDIKKVLGSPERESINPTKENNVYYWLGDIVKTYENTETLRVERMVINFRKSVSSKPPLYFLIDGTPLEKDMTMGDFVNLSPHGFDEFHIGHSS